MNWTECVDIPITVCATGYTVSMIKEPILLLYQNRSFIISVFFKFVTIMEILYCFYLFWTVPWQPALLVGICVSGDTDELIQLFFKDISLKKKRVQNTEFRSFIKLNIINVGKVSEFGKNWVNWEFFWDNFRVLRTSPPLQTLPLLCYCIDQTWVVSM